MKRRDFFKMSAGAVAVGLLGGGIYKTFAAPQKEKAKVYYAKEITPEKLKELYHKVNQDISGKVAIKLHTGEANGPNLLPRELAKALQADIPDSTIVECNVLYGSLRQNTVGHRKVLEINGWTFCPMDIMDADGDVNLPIVGGKHLKEVAVGKHIENYDSMVVYTHFKGHAMGGFGGSLKNIAIGCASGKGGVGKSTTSVNLALALANQNKKVAIFDADIYGPSLPTMLGFENTPPISYDGKLFEPLQNFGIKAMSIGSLIGRDTPLIWRGAKACGAIEQLLTETNWGEIDFMVIDMPPGTGDIQLTLSQRIDFSGIVIVSTPQDIALIDAIKGVNMFKKIGIKILGIVENMSYYICEKCGHRADIFGHEGAKKTAENMGETFLGEIPLHLEIRQTSDNGTPIVAADPDSPHTLAYEQIAKKIIALTE